MRRVILRTAFAGAAMLLVAGIVAPFVRADRFSYIIKDALQRSLNRRVEIGTTAFSLFGGPGFVVESVLIHEDPSVGIEPFAHVMSLEARIALSSLWSGHLEFSRLLLVEPRVNLVKPAAGGWNIAPLLMRGTGAPGRAGTPARLPTIEVQDGRINLKFGDTKSPFYITNADLTISRRTGRPGSFDVQFTGEPGRTDRAARGFGVFACRGRLDALGGAEPTLDLVAELERSSIVEISELLSGRDYGLHGLIASEARIRGPISQVRITGSLTLEDVHRWDLMPGQDGNGWRIRYAGSADWYGQRLEVTASRKQNPGLPLSIQLRTQDVLGRNPRWGADLTVEGLPAAKLFEVAGHLGATVPRDLEIEGEVSGVAGYSPKVGIQGQAVLSNTTLTLPGVFQYSTPRAEIAISGTTFRLDPALIQSAPGRTAIVEGHFNAGSGEVRFDVKSHALGIVETQAAARHLFGGHAVPLLANFSGGTWSGTLDYRSAGESPVWTGEFAVRDVRAEVPGLSEDVRLSSASVQLSQQRVTISRMRARAGTVEFEGDYRFDPAERRQHRVRLTASLIGLADIQRLFAPALKREQGFFARTLRRPARTPAWLSTLHAHGALRIGLLDAGEDEWGDVRTDFTWDGTDVQFTKVRARMQDVGSVSGTGSLDLASASPRFRMEARVERLRWRDGEVDLEGEWETRGLGPEFLSNLRSEGTFQARSVSVLPDAPLQSVSGGYEFAMDRGGPRVKLSELDASLGSERYLGNGETQADGRLQIELASGTRVMRFAGPILPLKLEFVSTRP